jgi:hypothetical protein
MLFYSVSVDFDFKVVVKPNETYKTIAAKNRHDGDVSGILQTLLESLVDAGRTSRISTLAGVAVEVSE